MRTILIFCMLLITVSSANAMRIYRTSTMGESHLRVAIVDSRGEADIAVHRVPSPGMANGKYNWFITPIKAEADLWIYVTSPQFAQCKIIFVDNYGEAGAFNPQGAFKCFRR